MLLFSLQAEKRRGERERTHGRLIDINRLIIFWYTRPLSMLYIHGVKRVTACPNHEIHTSFDSNQPQQRIIAF
jgi:hypothetical protein